MTKPMSTFIKRERQPGSQDLATLPATDLIYAPTMMSNPRCISSQQRTMGLVLDITVIHKPTRKPRTR
jgi:hypothetical protein